MELQLQTNEIDFDHDRHDCMYFGKDKLLKLRLIYNMLHFVAHICSSFCLDLIGWKQL